MNVQVFNLPVWITVSVCCCCTLTTVFVVFPIEKECDLSKHCRVLDLERKKLCHQELQYAICNVNCVATVFVITRLQIILKRTSAVCTQAAPILQQKATGGKKICDQLAVEQRRASVGYKMARSLGKSKDRHQHLEAFDEKTATQGSRQTTNSSSHMFRYEMWLFFHILCNTSLTLYLRPQCWRYVEYSGYSKLSADEIADHKLLLELKFKFSQSWAERSSRKN